MKKNIRRRHFLKTGAAAAGAAWAAPNIIPARVWGGEGAAPPSEKIGVGVIGCGFKAQTGFTTDTVAVCDPIKERRDALAAKRGNCKAFNDVRELLADPSVDMVYVVTGDYWHVPMTMLAMQAGKHCYTEKPLGTSIAEDLACRDFVKKAGLGFAYGTWQRGQPQYRKAMELVLNGFIGEIKELYAWSNNGSTGGTPRPAAVPPGIDYELWLGPAPFVPFCEARVLNKGGVKPVYHNYDYSIGFIAGWGAHQMDIVQWWADLVGRGAPVRVEGTGVYDPAALQNAISSWDMTCRFADGTPVYFMSDDVAETKTFPKKKKANPHEQHGNTFIGTDGWLCVSRDGMESSKGDYATLMRTKLPEINVPVTHSDLGRAGLVMSAAKGDQNAIAKAAYNVDSAARSDITCHLCDISIRLGRPIRWDPVNETIIGDAEAIRMMRRPLREPWSWETILKA